MHSFISISLFIHPNLSIDSLMFKLNICLPVYSFIHSFIHSFGFFAFLFVCLSIIVLGDYTTSLKRSSDEGLTLEESALKLLTVANLRYQLS